MGGSLGSATSESSSLNFEGILGYEFRHNPHFKTFIQLEISQPVFYIKSRSHQNYTPGVALSLGVGF